MVVSCLTKRSHYLNQCWLIICEVFCPSPLSTGNAQGIYRWHSLPVKKSLIQTYDHISQAAASYLIEAEWSIYASVNYTSLVQIMDFINSTLRSKLQWNFKRNAYLFIEEHRFENVVWKMANILSRPQCVKKRPIYLYPAQSLHWHWSYSMIATLPIDPLAPG